MGDSFLTNWTTQIRKGILELCILTALRRGRRLYGYDIVKRLRQLDGLMIAEGTIYPILSRFKQEGFVTTALVESAEGPARKYYQLSARGEKHLSQMQAHWEMIKSSIQTLGEETQS